MRRATFLALTVVSLLAVAPAAGRERSTLAATVTLDAAVPATARRLLTTYREPDRRRYLDAQFRLQIVAGDYAGAQRSLTELQRGNDPSSPWSATAFAQYAIFVRAKQLEAAGAPFRAAFQRSFQNFVGPLDDRRAALVVRRFAIRATAFDDDLRAAARRVEGVVGPSQADALALVRAYQLARMYAEVAPFTGALIAADDRRRYVIDTDHLIATPDGAHLCALIVRPRATTRRLPALLQLTIYGDRVANLSEARRSASNGYADVEALSRGKGCSPDAPVPYRHDGADGAAAIAWIVRQPWSDGRVGMYGGSYNSFAQWAVAKRRPRALKALMPAVSNAPGIDTPMEGSVFESWDYYWPFYATTGKWLDASSAGDPSHWTELQRRWYASGKPYRAMDRIDGRPNPIWDEWLRHPSYDAYWQQLIPYENEFARIGIPVLTTDGYLSGQNVGSLYYFEQYEKYDPRAEKYLVLGPYDHISGQRGTVSSQGDDLRAIAGYPIDPAARIDIGELRYGWFGYIFKGAPKPAILRDRVNYEVMSANRWKHAPSIAAMHEGMLRFYLTAGKARGAYVLAARPPRDASFIPQHVDLADRSDIDRKPPADGLDAYLAVPFASAPFAKPFDLTGLFAGRLDFVTNKKDFDFNLDLYELTKDGRYVAITNVMERASYAGDRSRRRLLTPGKRTRLGFRGTRLASWRIHAGSRLVVLLGIVKDPGYPINFGTGKDVSDESVADGRVPLRIDWFGGSFVDIPAS
ncbi:MAG TPA: CocE/NonD family hydrolase [Candidatus Elarobacter sp.]|jgi:putative CocE/NonD family hydrolase|nr:CocE/NonD family hydrolase [Candidatus Elarobacter sp.]